MLPEHRRAVEPDADRPPAHCRVVLGRLRQIGQHLVAADVERAEEDRTLLRLIEHALVVFGEILDIRESVPHHQRELGAKQANALGAGRRELREIKQQSRVQHQLDRYTVAGDRRDGEQGLVIGAAAAARLNCGPNRLLYVGAGPDQHIGVISIDDDDVARLDPARRIADPPDDRDVEGARHNRDMGSRRAFLEYQTHDPPASVVQQLRRSHRAGDEDELGWQFGPGRAERPSGQMLLQPVGEILEVE